MNVSANFTEKELSCPCCGLYNIDQDFLDTLQKARSEAGFPFVIESGTRCGTHNRLVGGVAGSSHVDGVACDVRALTSQTRFRLLDVFLQCGFHRIGISKTFVHVDMDRSKPYPSIWLY